PTFVPERFRLLVNFLLQLNRPSPSSTLFPYTTLFRSVALSVRARDSYEQLAPALRETTGIDIGFWRSGIAAVAFDEAAANRLKRSEEHTSELQSRSDLVCRLLLEKKQPIKV